MPLNKKKSLVFAAMSAALLLAGCASSPPSKFYTLAEAPSISASTSAASSAGQSRQLFIEMMPVAVPERLARPQIVVRSDATRVDVLETERWSSPFNSELRDALAAGVSRRLGAIDVSRSGKPADQVGYRIAVELRELDAARSGQVQAAFGWTVTRSDDRKTAVCRLSVVEPVKGAAIADVVEALQTAVANASDAIANNVRALDARQTVSCAG